VFDGRVPSSCLPILIAPMSTAHPPEDLSKIHKPISNFIGTIPVTKNDWQKYKLTEQQIEQFNRDGYIKNIPVLSEQQCDILLRDLSQLMDPNHPGFALWYEFHSNETGDPHHVLFHSLGAWRISVPFHDILWHPAVLVPAAQLLGNRPIRFWHDQLFVKPPRCGSVVAWHQDYSYWTRTQPMAHLTIHIALDDQTVENGCLHYIPGSHKWSLLPITSRHFNDMESILTVLSDEQRKQFKPAPMLLKRGEACFHHALTVHGSYGNKSDKFRRATVINVFADGTLSNSDEPLLEGVNVIPKGSKIDGQFFPLLFDPQGKLD
jgi:hypothetical protein